MPRLTLRVLITIAAITLAAVGCRGIIGERGSGNVITETRDVSGFSAIDLAGQGRVEITFGDTESLVIEAEDNLMPLLTSDVSGGTLELGTTENINPTEDIVYSVTVVSLDGLFVSGSGEILAPDVEGDSLELDVSGSGELLLSDLDIDAVAAEIGGSGSIELSGVASQLDASISGSGTLDAEALSVDRADVSISGSGDAVVDVSDELVADISGSGSIEYLGNPIVDSNVSGSGSIEPR